MIYEGLLSLQATQNEAVSISVDEINRIAQEMVELNKAIYGL
jgi:flagellar hook-associated protein FlgK